MYDEYALIQLNSKLLILSRVEFTNLSLILYPNGWFGEERLTLPMIFRGNDFYFSMRNWMERFHKDFPLNNDNQWKAYPHELYGLRGEHFDQITSYVEKIGGDRFEVCIGSMFPDSRGNFDSTSKHLYLRVYFKDKETQTD
jgi:hypothetical protein